MAAENAAREALSLGLRKVDVVVKGPGAGREAAVRSLQAAGLEIHVDPRRHPDPPQRLPGAQETESLVAGHPGRPPVQKPAKGPVS